MIWTCENCMCTGCRYQDDAERCTDCISCKETEAVNGTPYSIHCESCSMREQKVSRLETLKQELEAVKNLKCLSFDLKAKVKAHYEKEIECAEVSNG